MGLKCKAKSFPSKNRRQEASFDQIRRIYSVLATFETLHLKVTYWSIFEFCYQKVEKILFVKRAGLPPSGGARALLARLIIINKLVQEKFERIKFNKN